MAKRVVHFNVNFFYCEAYRVYTYILTSCLISITASQLLLHTRRTVTRRYTHTPLAAPLASVHSFQLTSSETSQHGYVRPALDAARPDTHLANLFVVVLQKNDAAALYFRIWTSCNKLQKKE